MDERFLDKVGFSLIWNKIKTLLSNKSDKSHTHSYNDLTNKPTIPSAYTHPSSHPASMITGLADVATTGDYTDLNNIPVISNKGFTGDGVTWYFPLGEMVVDDSGNYGNFTIDGRIGGWTNGNSAVYSIMLMNRGDYSGDIITSTVSAFGTVPQALSVCDILVAKNSDKSHSVYLKCTGYFLFNFEWTAYQHSITYDGTHTTTEPSNIIWRLSEAPKTTLSKDGVFTASGGINANLWNGYGLRIAEEGDEGEDGYLTVLL